MKKSLKWFLGMGLFPFICVWISYILTGLAFDPQTVFHSGAFWGLSVLYWIIWSMAGALMLDNKDF